MARRCKFVGACLSRVCFVVLGVLLGGGEGVRLGGFWSSLTRLWSKLLGF